MGCLADIRADAAEGSPATNARPYLTAVRQFADFGHTPQQVQLTVSLVAPQGYEDVMMHRAIRTQNVIFCNDTPAVGLLRPGQRP